MPISSFIKKPFKRFREGSGEVVESADYIDLGQLVFEDEKLHLAQAKAIVRLAELYKSEDLNLISREVYTGNIVIIDISAIASDDLALRRVTSDLKNIANDVGGDIAGIAKNLLMLTPFGIKIDRQKIRQ